MRTLPTKDPKDQRIAELEKRKGAAHIKGAY
jgi:hypothetical protein